MPLFDFKCEDHGVFEGTHPICPAMGCRSKHVTKVFLKAPGIRSDFMKRFDAGIQKSADNMNLTDFRSAKEGEAAHGGKLGEQVLWGSEVNKLGKSFPEMATIAERSSTFTKKDGSQEKVPYGMPLAAQAGITSEQALKKPSTEKTVHKADLKS